MKEYNYYIWYDLCEKDSARKMKRSTPLTIHDLKGNKIASEIITEIEGRINEMEDSETYRTFVEITNISLLNIHQTI